MSGGPQADRDVKLSQLGQGEGISAALSGDELHSIWRRNAAQSLSSSTSTGLGEGLDLDAQGAAKRDLPFAPYVAPSHEEEIENLEAENKHLKQYTVKLQNELERWIRKYKNAPDRIHEMEDDVANDEGSLAPWIASPNVFSPLVIAYETRIGDLRATARAAERQLAEDRDLIAQLTQQNDSLQEDLNAELQARIKGMQQTDRTEEGHLPSSSDTSQQISAVTNDTIQMLNDLVDSLKRENSILQERDIVLNKDIEALSEEGKERDAQLLKITENFQSTVQGLRNAKEQIDVLRKERDAALHQLHIATEQISQLQLDFDHVKKELGHKKQQNNGLITMVSKLRGDMEDLAARANAESDLQQQRVDIVSKRSRKVQLDLEASSQELESLKIAHQDLLVKHESMKHDCGNLRSALQALQMETNTLKQREASVKALQAETQERMETASLEREKALALATQHKEEISRLHEERIATAEANVKEQDDAIEKALLQMKAVVTKRNHEIEERERRLVQLNLELERAKRENLQSTASLDKVKRSNMEEIKALSAKIAKQSEKLQKAEFDALEREAQAQQAKQQFAIRSGEVEQERVTMLESSQSLRQQLETANAHIESLKAESQRLTRENDDAINEAAKMRQELANARLSMDARLEMTEQRAKLSEQRSTVRVMQVEAKEAELEQALENANQLVERLKAHHQDEFAASTQHFERLISEQKEECARLRFRGDELAAQLQVLQRERGEMNTLLRQHEERIRKLDKETHTSDKRASQAKAQLAQIIASQQDSVKQVAELRRKLDQAEIQIGRAERERDAALASLEERPLHSRHVMSTNRPVTPRSRQVRLGLEAQRVYAVV